MKAKISCEDKVFPEFDPTRYEISFEGSNSNDENYLSLLGRNHYDYLQ